MCVAWLLFLILTLYLRDSTICTTSTAVCFLTVRSANEVLESADRLARAVQQDNIDVFAMADDNSFKVPSSEKSVV